MDTALELYLEKIDRRLRPMPLSERADIVREIKSGMLELESLGLRPEEITARLGSPRELAAAYLGEAIVKNPRFSFRRLGTMAAFYSLAGLGGMIVLPAASITAVTFLACGALIPAMGLGAFLASLLGVQVPWYMVRLGSWTAPPALAFPISAAVGLLLLLAGRGLWRASVGFVRMVQKKRRSLT